MTKYNGRFANCCTQNTISLFMPEGSINRMSVKNQTSYDSIPLVNKFDTFFLRCVVLAIKFFLLIHSNLIEREIEKKADWSFVIYMEQLSNCLRPSQLWSKPIKVWARFYGWCVATTANDLMKRLIYLIDTLIDSLQCLFNTNKRPTTTTTLPRRLLLIISRKAI